MHHILHISPLTMLPTNIIQKPIIFTPERVALTQHYLLDHYDIDQPTITITPEIIVLHWTEIATLEETFNVLDPPLLSNRPDIASSGKELNVSAHYLVDRDGAINQLMPDNWMARHVIGLNHVAIGIENVGGVHSVEDLTSEQVAANVSLVKYLHQKYPSIAYLIGHHEYGNFRESDLWLEKNPDYFTIKKDPGDQFMMAVREKVKHLNFHSSP